MKAEIYGLSAALIAICSIDWWLGPTAEYVNAYEIVRRSMLPALPKTTDRYLFAQDHWGRFALLVGWFAWTLEAALVTRLVKWGLIGCQRCTRASKK